MFADIAVDLVVVGEEDVGGEVDFHSSSNNLWCIVASNVPTILLLLPMYNLFISKWNLNKIFHLTES